MIYCYDCRFENRATPCLAADGRRDFDKLAAAYIDELQTRKRTGARPVDSWAWECVSELERSDPHSALFFILVALDSLTVESQRCLAVLAAGPLENILDHFGEEIIGAIEVIGRRSAKFRLLLSAVWGERRVKPQVWRRIRAVLAEGPRLDDDHRTPGYGTGAAVASEPDVRAQLETDVLDDLGGRAKAAAIVGLD